MIFEQVKSEAQKLAPFIIDLRRKLHRIPELGFKEKKTQKVLFNVLQEHGYVINTAARTGLFTFWEGTEKGKIVALRADMDGIPVQEETGLPYASEHPGIMHACGHDAHMAMLVGAAVILKNVSPQVKGSVLFIFQPAEETPPGGAKEMISEGLLERTKPEAIFALHVNPFFPAGQLAVRPGPFMAAGDRFLLQVKGRGGHGAMPHKTVDPVYVASAVVQGLQQIIGRQINPLEPAVISIGKICGGEEFNIIPSQVEITGTVRTLNHELRRSIPQKMEHLIRGITAAYGADYSFEYEQGYPLLENERRMTEFMFNCAREFNSGHEPRLLDKPSTGSEDFAYFLERVPGSYAFFGVENGKTAFPLHSPEFQLNEEALPLGAAFLASLVVRYLI
ncbi:MAG: M20 metallopeptidase family protein [Dethiobacteria bacterium]